MPTPLLLFKKWRFDSASDGKAMPNCSIAKSSNGVQNE